MRAREKERERERGAETSRGSIRQALVNLKLNFASRLAFAIQNSRLLPDV